MSKRFAEVDEQSMSSLIKAKYSKNTLHSERHAQNLFGQYLQSTGNINRDINDNELDMFLKETAKPDLEDMLLNFFVSIRKTDGENMKQGTLRAIIYSLNRHLKDHCGYDITDKHSFPKLNEIIICINKQLKAEGLATTSYFEPLSNEDVKKVVSSLDINNPQEQQWLIFFYLQIFFCRRGQENLQNFTKDTFAVMVDENSEEYVAQRVDELTKNHREKDHENTFNGTMHKYSNLGEKCPVAIFKLYLSKLNPKCNRFWQHPANLSNSDYCYSSRPIGINEIAKFMKKISHRCSLSRIYTNHCLRCTCITYHCLRCTCITLLGEQFLENEIKNISGHRSISCLGIYKKISQQRKKCMSTFLSSKIADFNVSLQTDLDNDLSGEISVATLLQTPVILNRKFHATKLMLALQKSFHHQRPILNKWNNLST